MAISKLLSEADVQRILSRSLSLDNKEGEELISSYVGRFKSPIAVKPQEIVDWTVAQLRLPDDSFFAKRILQQVNQVFPISKVLNKERGFIVAIGYDTEMEKTWFEVKSKAFSIDEDPKSKTEFLLRSKGKKSEIIIKSTGILPPVPSKVFPMLSTFLREDAKINPYGTAMKVIVKN